MHTTRGTVLLILQLAGIACATTSGTSGARASGKEGLARAEERRACEGIPDQDRDEGPFSHPEEIEGVDILTLPIAASSGGGRVSGASIHLRALPGMTAEWLQRVTDCHLAHDAVTGDARPGRSGCPLNLRGVTATVTSTGRGFAIDIRSDDVETANEIIRRGRALPTVR